MLLHDRHASAAAAAVAAVEADALDLKAERAIARAQMQMDGQLAAIDIVAAVEHDYGSVCAAIDASMASRCASMTRPGSSSAASRAPTRPSSSGSMPREARGCTASTREGATPGYPSLVPSASQPSLPPRPSTGRMIRLPNASPVPRPGSASGERLPPLNAPAVDPAGAPAMPPAPQELIDARERSRQLEKEIRAVKAMAAQDRSRLQAFADTHRMQGERAPSDGAAAFWLEARALLEAAVSQVYGSKLQVTGQQLTPGELRRVRMTFEQKAQGGGSGTSPSVGQVGADDLVASAPPAPPPPPSPPPAKKTVPLDVHEAALRELRLDLEEEAAKAAAKAEEEARVALEKAVSSHARESMALTAQLEKIQASADAKADEEAAKAKEERVSLLSRQLARRMQNREVAIGFTAWVEHYRAKQYAITRLHEVGNRLRSPGLTMAFDFWAEDAAEAKRRREHRAALLKNDSLEAQLRRARYDMTAMQMVNVAHADEARGLREKVAQLTAQNEAQAAEVAKARGEAVEAANVREEMDEELGDAKEAKERAVRAETDAAKQIRDSDILLRRLLGEQRERFEAETAEMKAQLEAKTAAQEREARLEVMRSQAMRRLLHAGLARGWAAWTEMYATMLAARELNRKLSSRMAVKGVGGAFVRWVRSARAAKDFLEKMSKEEQRAVAERLEGELERMRSLNDAVAAERDALMQQLMKVGGRERDTTSAHTAEVQSLIAEQQAAEKARRVDVFGKQALRRIIHAGLRDGFSAWRELADARTYALATMQRVSRRMRQKEVWNCFREWQAGAAELRASGELRAAHEAPQQLSDELATLTVRFEQMKTEYEARLEAAAHEQQTALARQKVELMGSVGEREALLQERAREERIEILRRQVIRRVRYGDLANKWAAWVEHKDAKLYALARLQQIGNRLRSPELSHAWAVWDSSLREERERSQMSVFDVLQEREAMLTSKCERLEREVERVTAEAAARVARIEEDKARALSSQLTELTGSAGEIAALREQEEKEGRIDLLRRQIGRRLLYSGLTRGWSAWTELWEAKRHAYGTLQRCSNKLNSSTAGVAHAFEGWVADLKETQQALAWQQLEAQSSGLEAQLRQARYESKRMVMVKTAQDDQLSALRAELEALYDEKRKAEQKLIGYGHMPDEVERLRAAAKEADAAAKEAISDKEAAEGDVLKQLDESQKLLEKLLAEQRKNLSQDLVNLKRELKSEVAEKGAVTAELAKLRQAAEAKEKANEAELTKLRAEVKRLSVKPEKKVKKPKPMIDLDESPGAPPISEQLAGALRENATRVLDLFRSWDADGDGQVSRAEFHKAMPALGLEVPKKVIDDLFSEWDRDGGGEIGYPELRKILQAPRGGSATPASAKTPKK